MVAFTKSGKFPDDCDDVQALRSLVTGGEVEGRDDILIFRSKVLFAKLDDGFVISLFFGPLCNLVSTTPDF